MHPWPGAWGFWGMTIMMLLWVAIIVAVIWFVYRLAKAQGWLGEDSAGRDGAERILRERYARGEIDQDTYARMLEDLRRGSDG